MDKLSTDYSNLEWVSPPFLGRFEKNKGGYIMNFSKALALFAMAGLVSVANAALADGGVKFLGNITTGGQVRGDMGDYWNQITAENGCKWGSIHSLSNGNSGTSKFAWDNYDKCEGAYKWAKEKPGRHFKFHALVWGSQYPQFLCKKKNPSITVEKTKQYITEWFDAVAAKFPDLEYIDVVNEAIWSGNNYHSGYQLPAGGAEGVSTDDASCGGSYIIEALGGDRVVNGKHQYDFITTAFKMARERWPKAVLIYNDYNTLHWQKNEGIELVQTIIKNGAPVDAYGQQAHDAGDFPDASSFAKVLTEVHDAVKIPLYITEYDIGEADDQRQKNIIANQIPFLWETPWIAGITIWGYINGSTWRKNTGIMNSDGTDRAAMTWLRQYFKDNLNKGQCDGVTVSTSEINYSDEKKQEPYNGTAIVIDINDTIQAEHYDKPGIGFGNDSYSDGSDDNKGDANFRMDEAVDIYVGGPDMKGLVIGYTEPGDWVEYTVVFKRKGPYTIKAGVSSANDSSSFRLYVDDVPITDEMFVPKTGEDSWDTYQEIGGKVDSVSTGMHILKVESVRGWFNLDYIVFENIAPPEVIAKEDSIAKANDPNGTKQALFKTIRLGHNVDAEYDIISIRGERLGHISARSAQTAVETLKNSPAIKTSGIYYLRSRATGEMHGVRVIK